MVFYQLVGLLQIVRRIYVRHQYVGMPRLVAHRYRVVLAQHVGYAGVLQAVKLVFRRKFERLAHVPVPVVPELLLAPVTHARHELVRKKVIIPRIAEHAQLYHQRQDFFRDGNRAILPVLAVGR